MAGLRVSQEQTLDLACMPSFLARPVSDLSNTALFPQDQQQRGESCTLVFCVSRETARELAQRGAVVVIACRDLERAEEAAGLIR